MKFLIVGLGNIGAQYENTRHNIGFQVLDALIKANSEKVLNPFGVERLALTAQYKFKGKTFLLVKPSTFMNLSGRAVQYWKQKENIPLENILAITDDIALPFGTLRLKTKGSDGGHNGLKSIQEALSTENFPRLRFGIGSSFPKGKQVDYVLSEWSEMEKKILPERISTAGEIIHSFATVGIERTMGTYNRRKI